MISLVAAPLASLIVAVMVAVVLCSLLVPIQVLLNHKLRLPRMVGAVLTVVGTLGALGLILWLVVARVAGEADQLRDSLSEQLDGLSAAIEDNPLPIGKDVLASAAEEATNWLQSNQAAIFGGAWTFGSSAAQLVFSAFLCLVTTIFLLGTGDRVWAWIVDRFRPEQGERIFEASRRGWVALSTYVRMQVLIAAIDAAAITVGAFFLGLPFLMPLALITFVLCIIPFLGAIISGALFVLVALLTGGPVTALIMLVIVIAVQQLEGDILSPVLMGRAVNLHPLALLLGTTAGTYPLGFAGALFAVPTMAVANSVRLYLGGKDPFPGLDDGGSALHDSARKVAAEDNEPKIKRFGRALPEVVARRDSVATHAGLQD